MNVILYSFSKRKNSTKIPTASTGTTISCQLKENCSVLNPTLIFNPGNGAFSNPFSPSQFNYANIPFFGRYYFVDDWTFLNGVWECRLSVDVLASFKTSIGTTSSYILRSSAASDGTIIDGKYPATSEVTIQRVPLASSWYMVAPSGGCYVVGIINNIAQGNVGSVCYYAFTSAQLANLLNYLFSDNIYNASSIDEIGSGLFKSMFNPFQYIVSAVWFPFAIESIASSNTVNVVVGYWQTNISAFVVGSIAQTTYITGDIPNHPQLTRGEYLNYAPYTTITLYIEPFGAIPLDTSFRNIGDRLYSEVFIDHITGKALLRVAITESASLLNSSRIITERTAEIGVPIQLAQAASDYIGTLQSGASAIQSALSMNFVGIGAGILNALDSAMPKVATMGVNGSFSMTIPSPLMVCEFRHIAEENQNEYGRPLFDTRTISTIPGYIECGAADHAFSSFSSENDRINEYMKNGFYYE